MITKTLNDIEIFKEKIDELDFEKLKVDKIKSLKDYFRLEKHFLVLKQYKEAYFPYIQMETNYYPQNELIEIINKYNMLSSSKSTIDLYAEPEFWGYNIEQLVADYNENGRIHRKAVDTLIHFEKNPDRKNINFFVRLINIYLNNQKELKIMQNDLYQKNIDASTIDKAKEAYDAFEYRRTLDTHVHLYDDIDFKNKIIHIRRTITRTFDDRATIGSYTKTVNGIRDIMMDSNVENILKEYLSSDYYTENDYNLLFCNSYKECISTDTVNVMFKEFCKNYSIGKGYDVHQHMLRHTFATRCIESGMPASVLAKIMGHANVATTLNVYCEVFDKFKKEHLDLSYNYLKENGLTLDF